MTLESLNLLAYLRRQHRALAARRWRPGMLAVIGLTAVSLVGLEGCKKKSDAVEAVDPAGKKPPVVRKKPKEGDKPLDVAQPPTPTGLVGAVAAAPGGRPAQPALAAPGASPLPTVSSPTGAPVAADPAAPIRPAAAEAPPRGVAGMPGPLAGADPAIPPPVLPATPQAVATRELPTPAGAPPVPEAPRGAAARPERAAEPAPPARGEPAPARGDGPAARAEVEAPEVPAVRVVPPIISGEPSLDVTGYLSVGDIERVLGPKAKMHRADLNGTSPSPSYNYLYFKKDKSDDFGVAVQVWRDSNAAESRTRFATMKNTYSNVAPTNKVADQGFRAFFGGVVTLVFSDPRRPLVAAVSCSTKACNADQMIEFSKRVAERLH